MSVRGGVALVVNMSELSMPCVGVGDLAEAATVSLVLLADVKSPVIEMFLWTVADPFDIWNMAV